MARLGCLIAVIVALAPLSAVGQVYKWVDKDGVTHYGDSIPAEYAELPKDVINEHGVVLDSLEGKKSAEELEAVVGSKLTTSTQSAARTDTRWPPARRVSVFNCRAYGSSPVTAGSS